MSRWMLAVLVIVLMAGGAGAVIDGAPLPHQPDLTDFIMHHTNVSMPFPEDFENYRMPPVRNIDANVGADFTRMRGSLQMGRLEANGTHFEIENSNYLNITLDSSEPVKLALESAPEMVTMRIESLSGADSTLINLGGFAPETTYHKYEDDYHNHTAFTTDASGSYSYKQDLSSPHLIFIQPRASTKFINDNATGGDCTLIGTWNAATKTCTLTTDLTETIQIDSDGITLDGSWHTITGSNTSNGVYLSGRTGVDIKNLNVEEYFIPVSLSTIPATTR